MSLCYSGDASAKKRQKTSESDDDSNFSAMMSVDEEDRCVKDEVASEDSGFSAMSCCTQDSIDMQATAAAADVLPPQRGKIKAAIVQKKPAKCLNPQAKSVSCGLVKLQLAKMASYVTAWDPTDKKWKLVFESHSKKCAEHGAIAQEIFERMQKEAIDKPACVALRDKLHRKHSSSKIEAPADDGSDDEDNEDDEDDDCSSDSEQCKDDSDSDFFLKPS